MKDLYKILGVPESADESTIKKAYRKLAKENHPDVTGGDKKKTERFKEINEAYDVLSDKEKRAAYNSLKSAPVRPDGMPEGFDADTFARTFGGGARVGRGGPGGFGSDGSVDINDIFASLFGTAPPGGAGGTWGGSGWVGQRSRPSRGNDIAGEIEVTFAEAALGVRRSIRTGAGATLEVSIPAGVETGSRLRVGGQGAPAPASSGKPGDLYLDISVRPDKHFRRHEWDIELDVPVTVAEAALGAKIQVPTVDGPVTMSVPPGTSSGAKLRLRGRGIKRADGTRGDQLCRIEVAVPKGAAEDAELRRLFEEIARHTSTHRVRDF